MAEWRFRTMTISEMNANPIQTKFFQDNELGNSAVSLVREAIQNSLDAKLKENSEDKAPVEVRFFLSGEKHAVQPKQYAPFFKSLIPHLQAKGNGLKQPLPDLEKDPLTYLLIEDFNTSGLEGDPKITEAEENDASQNFFWFWRNVGRTGKSTDQRGRWGVGKTVFPASSSLNTFFGLTCTNKGDQKLLMGQSVLKIHKITNETHKFCPYGFYGDYSPDLGDSFFALPEKEESTEPFEKIFKLERKDRLGLSILIPFPDPDITSIEILKAILVQYFYPIISGDLLIEIAGEGLKKPIVINKDSIYSSIGHLSKEDKYLRVKNLEKLFSFTKWAIELPDSKIYQLQTPESTYPVWRESWFKGESFEEQLSLMSERFENGEPLGFKIPVWIEKAGERPRLNFFNVFLEKDDDLQEAETHFVRDGITILKVRSLRKSPVRALCVIQNNLLAVMLGDAENVAHTEWQKKSEKFVGKYKNGDMVISFVEKSIEKVYNWLQKPAEGLDTELLLDIFYVEEEEGTPKKESNVSPGDSGDIGSVGGSSQDRQKPSFAVTKLNNGFKVYANNNLESLDDLERPDLNIKVAYGISKGNPFKAYSTLDFDLSKNEIELDYHGANLVSKGSNELQFSILDLDFEIKVTGFDSERDLIVKVQ